MITLNNQPAAFSLSGNPMVLDVSTDNQYSQNGDFAEFNLKFTAVPTSGDLMTLTLDSGSLILPFEFVIGTPDDSGYQIQNFAGFGLTFFAEELVKQLRKNYYINTHFFLLKQPSIPGEETITLTAKEKGTKWNCVLSDNEPYLTHTETTTGTDQIERENFKILMQVEKRQKGETEWIPIERELKPIQGNIKVDISHVLDNEYWKSQLPLPYPFQTLYQQAVGEYRVHLAEQYGFPAVIRQLTTTAQKYFVRGGLSFQEDKESKFFTSWLGNKRGFMSRITGEVELYPNEYHYLSYLHYEDSGQAGVTVQLNVQVTANDGAVTNNTFPMAITANFDMMSFNIDLPNLGIDPLTTRTFRIWVSKTGEPLTIFSQSISFRVRTTKTIDNLHVIYQNGLGFFESFNFRGLINITGQAIKTEARHIDLVELDRVDHVEFITETRGASRFQVNSGFMSKDEVGRVFDLIMSRRVFISRADRALLPVKITSDGDLELFNSKSGRLNSVVLNISKIEDNYYEPVAN